MKQAILLLGETDPRRFERLRADIDGILVFGTVGAQAEWNQESRLVILRLTYVTAAATSTRSLASTFVHEGTHAWLDRLGFRYDARQRERIEAICFRSQAAFGRKLMDPGDVIEIAERQLTRGSEYWTDESFRARNLSELHQLGVPKWCLRLLGRISRRRAA